MTGDGAARSASGFGGVEGGTLAGVETFDWSGPGVLDTGVGTGGRDGAGLPWFAHGAAGL